jgi:hypothetical protein
MNCCRPRVDKSKSYKLQNSQQNTEGKEKHQRMLKLTIKLVVQLIIKKSRQCGISQRTDKQIYGMEKRAQKQPRKYSQLIFDKRVKGIQ